MIFTKLLSLLLAAGFVQADPRDVPHVSLACGSMPEIHPNITYRPLQARQSLRDAGSHIKVYWNVISKDNTPEGGNIDDSSIHQQIKVLNQDFSPVGLSFELQRVKRTTNPSWFSLPYGQFSIQGSLEWQMKDALGVKDPAVLNVYSLESSCSWSLQPHAESTPSALMDGVVLHVSTLPSSTNPGHTLTHETGHWSGLAHTFKNGCNTPGDGVDDTPAHLHDTWECDKPQQSSCGTGLEPLDNFMNYLHDQCRRRFTPGQIERMRTHLKGARGITLGAPRTQVDTGKSASSSTTGTGDAGDGNINATTGSTVTTGGTENGSATGTDLTGTSTTNNVCSPRSKLAWVPVGGPGRNVHHSYRSPSCHSRSTPGTTNSSDGTDSDSFNTSGGRPSTPPNTSYGTDAGSSDTSPGSRPSTSVGTNTSDGTDNSSSTTPLRRPTRHTDNIERPTSTSGTFDTADDKRKKAREMYQDLMNAMSKFWEFMNTNKII